jgi:(p)ppGpp synthase/HD superfamily hydrolase
MRDLAQTNLQLYDQLVASGWPEDALANTRRGYELATDLFAGQLRPSGKPFLAHLVGTASALATADARADLVHAGLLHAAYTHGEFGDGRRGASNAKRTAVRTAVGSAVEDLVMEYAALRFTPAIVDDWLSRASVLSSSDRDLAVLRLANEIDDHVDLGMRVADRGADRATLDRTFAHLAELADEIGEPALAALARRVSAAERDLAVPTVLRSPAKRSWTTAPRSHRLRLGITVRRIPAVHRSYEVLVRRFRRR